MRKQIGFVAVAGLCALWAVSCKTEYGGYAFSVMPKEISLAIGATYKLEVEWPPDGTALISWSSNSGSATVNADGLVTGEGLGFALISVRALDGSGAELASSQCAVSIINDFRITPRMFQLANGTTHKLDVECAPNGTASISWSTDSVLVRVDSDGNVTGMGFGLAVITAKALDANGGELAVAQCEITIAGETIMPSDFAVLPTSWSLGAGETKQLSTYGVPGGTTVEWISDPQNVATVSTDGLVTAAGAGTAVVMAVLKDIYSLPLASATCAVTVTAGPVGVFAVVPATLSLVTGASATLSTENNPAGTTINWASSNSAFATVDDSGVVTAVSAGTATITATAKAGGVTLGTATCAVTVTVPAIIKVTSSKSGEIDVFSTSFSKYTVYIGTETSTDITITIGGGGTAEYEVSGSYQTLASDTAITVEKDGVLKVKNGTAVYEFTVRQGSGASGGTVDYVTENGNLYARHWFTTVGSSTLSRVSGNWSGDIQALIVGGGGGGQYYGNGGGGGGGFFEDDVALSGSTSYTIKVGGGGAGGTPTSGTAAPNGEGSGIYNGATAVWSIRGGNGGGDSGGGESIDGGGAGGGYNGPGGAGQASAITGTRYSGGGGGFLYTPGGGVDGGGNYITAQPGADGTANTGGGGASGGPSKNGGAGGSGIVVVKMLCEATAYN